METKKADLNDLLDSQRHEILLGIHTSMPVRVASCNYDANTVTVEPMIQQILADGTLSDLPPLVDVLIAWPRGGGFAFTFPLFKGDEGMVNFAERCIDGWWETGNKSEPLDWRMHDLSDAWFVPGGCSKPKAIKSVKSNAIEMRQLSGGAYFSIDSGGVITADGTEMIIKCPVKMENTADVSGLFSYQNGMDGKAGEHGESTMSGRFKLTNGDITADGISLKNHKHGGVAKGGDISEVAQ